MSDTFSTIDPQRLGSGDPDQNKVLYGDGVWRVPDAAAAGITALTVTERAGTSTNVTTNSQASATATCDAGEISIGGGATLEAADTAIQSSRRSGTTGWTITARNSTGTTRAFTPYVICLEIT